MAEFLRSEFQAFLTAAIHVAIATLVTLHVLRRNLEVRAAAGWIGIVWLSPLLGAVTYYLLGINRVSRRAVRARRHIGSPSPNLNAGPGPDPDSVPDYLQPLGLLVERVTRESLVTGNRIDPLENGDAAYPAMLSAIESARSSIALSTYIFRADAAGEPFIEALSRAHKRGILVRVLLDGIGGGYFGSPARRRLERTGVPIAQFFHTWIPWRMAYLNMRLHKKMLIVDGTIGFVGGMNIGVENVHLSSPAAKVVQDLHCRIEGPVLRHLFRSFAEDWQFETGEKLNEELWCKRTEIVGSVRARGIASGPDEDLMKLEAIILAAVGAARHQVRIVTPYFVPEQILLVALALAALRGVRVEIVLPEQSNHRFMDWAAWAQHGFLLRTGCAIYLTPPPFDHTKVMTVDGLWSMFGSANWDVRSLRLNFEFNVAALGASLTAQMDALIDKKVAKARPVTLQMLNSRGSDAKIRDAAARLFLPYL